MGDLTRRQHYVPDFYLRQWSDLNEKITVHDLSSRSVFSCDPANVLVEKFFYEEDKSNPDNRIEKLLSSMEGRCSVTFKKLQVLGREASNKSDRREAARHIMSSLSNEDIDNILDFAAYQYLRVPGAIDQKEYETQVSNIKDIDRANALNPGRFVESGYAYISARFRSLNVTIFISSGTTLITSDWPCFDMKDSEKSPLLGEDIGRDPKVVCYMPLTPQLGAVFVSSDFSDSTKKAPRLLAAKIKDVDARNQNSLVVQQAEIRVISNREEKFIFSIADKRKKGRSNNQR